MSAKQIATTKISEFSSRTLQDLPQLDISKAAEVHPRCSEDNQTFFTCPKIFEYQLIIFQITSQDHPNLSKHFSKSSNSEDKLAISAIFKSNLFNFDVLNLQVLALSVVFFTLFAGNMTTLLYVLKQKVSKTIGVPEMPCG